MIVNTMVSEMAVLYGTDSAGTGGFGTALTDTLTEPTGDGVIDLANGGVLSANNVDLRIYTKESDNSALLMEVWGYRYTNPVSSSRGLTWIPTLMSYWTLTVCAQTGVTGGVFGTSYRMVDTVALTLGNANVTESFLSPVGTVTNTSGWIRIDTGGYRKLKILFSGSGGSGTNALYARS